MAWYILLHGFTKSVRLNIQAQVSCLTMLQIFLRAHWYYVHLKHPKNKQTNKQPQSKHWSVIFYY